MGLVGAYVVFGLVGMKMRHERIEATRKNNLIQIARAFLNYHNKCKHFPPAFVADKSGKPMHSWRVLILEMMPDQHSQKVFQQYDLSKPWNSPGNLAAGASAPDFFLNPLSNTKSQNTSYMVITGPGTIFDGVTPGRLLEITDGLSNTILVAEVDDSETNWMEPRDLNAELIPYEVNASGKVKSIAGFRAEGAMVATADGAVHLLKADIPSESLRRLIMRDDGQVIDNKYLK